MFSEHSEFAALTGRYLLAFVFLTASAPKLLARADFEAALANYGLLPPRLVPAVARWLPRLELACAAALFGGVALTAVGLTLAGLLLLFAGAISINLARGRRIECGCSGLTARKTIRWPVVRRNMALAGLAVGVATSTAEASDAIAALIAAGGLVLANLLVIEAHRTRSAAQAFTRRHSAGVAA